MSSTESGAGLVVKVSIAENTSEDRELCDAYIARAVPTPLWHSFAWRGPFAGYGRQHTCLLARSGERVVGVLPLVTQRSLLFGSRVTSLPWFDSSGVVADDEPAARALVAEGLELLRREGAARLNLRQSSPLFDWPVERDDKLAMQLPLTADPETLWKSFDPKVRNQVRKAEKSKVTTETLPAGSLREFFGIYSQNMRDLGSPPHSLRFFESVAAAFPGVVEVHLARVEGQIAGAGFTMRNGVRLDIPWASSLQEFNRLCINHALYWHILKHACQAGFQTFYFGRSTRDSGPHHFKKQWGAVEVPLYWYSLDRSGMPQVDRRPPQESFGLAIRIWKKLPVGIARRLGPWLISQLD